MGLPTERAYVVAERLVEQGLRGEALLEALIARGHPEVEARLAVNSLMESAKVDTRSEREASQKEGERQGYMSLLFASVCIAGGGLLATRGGDSLLLGGAVLALGLGLMVRGLWSYWKARGV